jgi:hypothetical protein
MGEAVEPADASSGSANRSGHFRALLGTMLPASYRPLMTSQVFRRWGQATEPKVIQHQQVGVR